MQYFILTELINETIKNKTFLNVKEIFQNQ